MRLSTQQIDAIRDKHDFTIVSEGHQSLHQLEDKFGPHTFLIGEDGLLILEEDGQACEDSPKARLVIVARWDDEEAQSRLVQTSPVATDVIINLRTGDASHSP